MRFLRPYLVAVFVSLFYAGQFGTLEPSGGRAIAATTAPSAGEQSDHTSSLSPQFTRQDILAYVEAGRSKISDLTVSFSFNATHSGPDDAAIRDHTKIILKGSMIYSDEVYGGDASKSPRLYDRELAFNGHIGTIHQKSEGIASFGPEKPIDCRVRGTGFFDLGWLNPPIEGGTGWNDQSLISLVKSSTSKMRPQLEIVAGHPCYVFDAFGPESDATDPMITAWLDPQQGFLPIKVVYFLRSTPLMESDIYTSKEVLPGLWMPLRGRKYVYFRKDSPYIRENQEHIMIVDSADSETPAIAVNTGVKDDFFDLWKHLPPGTLLIDKQTRKMITVGGKDWRATADEAVASAAGQDLSVTDAASVGSPVTPASATVGPTPVSWWSNSVLLEVGSGVVVLVLLILSAVIFRFHKMA